MASSATATPASNAAVTISNGPNAMAQTNATGNANKNFKGNAANKPADERKGSGGPAFGGQRRNSTQKAWTQGTNPITQRPSGYSQSNGNANQQKAVPRTSSAPMAETNTPDKHANDRLTFLFAAFVGQTATVTVTNGDVFEGIFSSSSLDPHNTAWILKMAKQTKSGSQHANGANQPSGEYIGNGKEHTMAFERKDVVELSVLGVSFDDTVSRPQNGASTGFRTDTDISGNLELRERKLERWEPSGGAIGDGSLESSGNQGLGSNSGGWDQFEANERLYGLRSDYDETIYTTAIDRSAPEYQRRAANAERIAREIERESASNSHMAEERGRTRVDDSGMNEEEKYSGVQRPAREVSMLQAGQTNKYTPPARRPPTGQATVPGAPVDPAIISSQMARPAVPVARASQENIPPPAVPTAQDRTRASFAQAAANQVSQSGANAALPSRISQEDHRKASISGQSDKKGDEGATATVETDVRDAFKQFANAEKMRFQERRRNQAKHAKDIKLNDLKKFSAEFELKTLVPKDLVPIMAKDPAKQEEILSRAQKQAEKASHEQITKPSVPDVKRATASAKTEKAVPAVQAVLEQQNSARQTRSGHPTPQPARNVQQQNLPLAPNRTGPGLSARLMNLQNQQQQNRGQVSAIPSPVPIQDARVAPVGPGLSIDVSGPPRLGGPSIPSSATSTKFNAQALEFRPNPAAISFQPTGNPSAGSSPRSNLNALPTSRNPTPSGFFGDRKLLSAAERPSIKRAFNPIKRLRQLAEASKEDWTSNGGIRPAHKTGPRWDVDDVNKEKTYTEVFNEASYSSQAVPPAHAPHGSATLPPHQHQLPFHLQQGGNNANTGHAQHQPPPHMIQQQSHNPMMPHHYDPHRMHISSSASSMFPSPRLQHVSVAYQSPMAHGQDHGQYMQHVSQMPGYGVGPGGPQMSQFRQYPGGPPFGGQQGGQMGAPMMAHGPSNGPYMGIPQNLAAPFNHQMPMYSPGQMHSYPQHAPQPGSSGYPSPGRGAPMMMHQGSQQGQQPQQMMYGMSPGQSHQHLYQPQPGQVAHGRGYPQQASHYHSTPQQTHAYPHHPQHRNGSTANGYSQGGPPATPRQGPHAQPAAHTPLARADVSDDAAK